MERPDPSKHKRLLLNVEKDRLKDAPGFDQPLGGGLFELRSSLTTRRIARVIVCVFENELYALHGFIKKTQKTPEVDLDLAHRRKRQLERAR